jgi:sugar phosphate isomerase/epimerase
MFPRCADMKHLVSISTLHKLGEPLLGLSEEFANAGFDGISLDPAILAGLEKTDLQRLAAMLTERNMTVAFHGEFATPVKELLGLIELLGSQLATVTFDPELGWTSAGLLFLMDKMGPYLAELDRIAQDHGFKFGIEDFPETPFALKIYQDSLSRLLESDRFGILIDIGHFNLSANKYGYFKGLTPEAHLAQLPLKLLEIHLSDNDGTEDQHSPLGIGIVDYGSVARGLKRLAFDGLSTIEIEPRKDRSIAEAKADILQSFLYWKQVYEQQ